MSDLPDIDTSQVSFIAFFNAISQGGVSSVDPTEATTSTSRRARSRPTRTSCWTRRRTSPPTDRGFTLLRWYCATMTGNRSHAGLGTPPEGVIAGESVPPESGPDNYDEALLEEVGGLLKGRDEPYISMSDAELRERALETLHKHGVGV